MKVAIHQVCCGLNYLHMKGINHRNLSPTSIRISYPNFVKDVALVKLADFGVSRLPKPGSSSSALWKIAGSKSWVAPETYYAPSFTPAMDMYSLGLVVGFAFSKGLHPHGNDKEMRILRIKQAEAMTLKVEDLDLPPEVAVQVLALVQSLLNTDPDKRPLTSLVLTNPIFVYPTTAGIRI